MSTIQLEFRDLAPITGRAQFAENVKQVGSAPSMLGLALFVCAALLAHTLGIVLAI